MLYYVVNTYESNQDEDQPIYETETLVGSQLRKTELSPEQQLLLYPLHLRE